MSMDNNKRKDMSSTKNTDEKLDQKKYDQTKGSSPFEQKQTKDDAMSAKTNKDSKPQGSKEHRS